MATKTKSKKITDVFLKQQIKIAKDTLKMHDLGASIMGGMTKIEARELLKRHGLYTGEIKRIGEEPEPAILQGLTNSQTQMQ